MSAAHYPITGAPAASVAPTDGSVPLRLEIRDLQNNNPDQWNLYLLGLEAFQKLDETNDLSYYGIAGIHGRPYREWGNVNGTNDSLWQGYCTHTSILFAPWHRPYLALYEQVLYGIVQKIADSFPGSTRARYVQAAATFRTPYWDWAAQSPSGDGYFPTSVASPTVSVIRPESNGQAETIRNPLYSYKFNPLNPKRGDFPSQQGVPFDKWPTTLRWPNSRTSINATSQERQVVNAIANQFEGLQSNVRILLTDPSYQDFAAFSNHAWQINSPETYASLEDIHNTIHSLVGGMGSSVGHMSELDFSAFDPVFWLHHCNVDRLFAIWQALNPNSYTIDQPSGDGTFVISSSTVETASTPLAPFSDGSGRKYWNSEGVRNATTFNYAYPETKRWEFQNDEDYANNVADTVMQLYGGIFGQSINERSTGFNGNAGASRIAAGHTNGGSNGAQKPLASEAPAPKSGFHPFRDLLGKVTGDDDDEERERGGIDFEAEIGKADTSNPNPPASSYSITEYICNIKAPKHLLEQTYIVHVFLGEFPPSPEEWCTTPTLVGTFSSFGKPPSTPCSKCRDDADANVYITGTVPLTTALLKDYNQGNLGGMQKENVLPFLTKNLHWRVTGADGTEVERDQVAGLKVSVVTTDVQVTGGRLSYSGVYEVHPEVTGGRPAGHGTGDQV